MAMALQNLLKIFLCPELSMASILQKRIDEKQKNGVNKFQIGKPELFWSVSVV